MHTHKQTMLNIKQWANWCVITWYTLASSDRFFPLTTKIGEKKDENDEKKKTNLILRLQKFHLHVLINLCTATQHLGKQVNVHLMLSVHSFWNNQPKQITFHLLSTCPWFTRIFKEWNKSFYPLLLTQHISIGQNKSLSSNHKSDFNTWIDQRTKLNSRELKCVLQILTTNNHYYSLAAELIIWHA